MTKERKLAIQMWRMIREKVRRRTRPMDTIELFEIKRKFCMEHNINWWHQCWFCHYVRYNDPSYYYGEGCQRCPIADRTRDDVMAGRETGCCYGIYRDVIHGKTVAVRVSACNKIIKALQGKDPYKED